MNRRGFTLLEVLVALAVFALAGVAISKAAFEHLRSLDILQSRTFASWVASNRLSALQLEQQWPPKNNDKGSAEMGRQTWYWQQIVTDTADKDMRMVEIQVSDSENMQDIAARLGTFVIKPQAAKS